MNDKKLFKRIAWVVILPVVFSCAYFNTFYNAKKYYNRAYQATLKNRTDRPTDIERQNYASAIEKGLKLIDMYPNSKYVKDALLLVGKSYYYQQDYAKAKRKFNEFIILYPGHESAREAQLWLSKTDLAMNQPDSADQRLRELLAKTISKTLRNEAAFALGRLNENRRDFESAIDMYRDVDPSNKDLFLEAQYAIAMDYDTLAQYDQAAKEYGQIEKMDPTPELLWESRFRQARALKRMGQYDESMRLYRQLQINEKNPERASELDLEIADCLASQNQIDQALNAYLDVTRSNKSRTAAAEAYYHLGKLYQYHRHDYERALDQYTQVKKTAANSAYADSADIMGRDIQRLFALTQVVRMAEKGETGGIAVATTAPTDTMLIDPSTIDAANTDSSRYRILYDIAGRFFADSLMSRIEQDKRDELINRNVESPLAEGMDWKQWIRTGTVSRDMDLIQELTRLKERGKIGLAENPELKQFKVEEEDKNRFFLGELYWIRFELPDSAAIQFAQVAERFPESLFAPRALYNLGVIRIDAQNDSSGADSVFQRLIRLYPTSTFANGVRKRLGLALVPTRADLTGQRFREAESMLLDHGKAKEAIALYKRIWQEDPQGELAAKAAYSIGWVYENRLDSTELAYAAYDTLMKAFPNSVYADKVRSKIQVYTAEKNRPPEAAGPSPDDASAAADSVSTTDSAEIAPPEETIAPIKMPAVADTLPKDPTPQRMPTAVKLDTTAR